MSLELIVGPMFAGKTNLLIKKYNELNSKEYSFNNSSYYNCFAIDYSENDTIQNDIIISHNGNKIPCFTCNNLNYLCEDSKIRLKFLKAKNIFINEAQFFKNLKTWVLDTRRIFKKNIILCGLDLDYTRNSFGELMELSPYADIVYNLSGKCNNCNDKSIFTHRLCNSKNQILFDSTKYIPVCEKCWNQLNSEKTIEKNKIINNLNGEYDYIL